jgi:hypothetical protein
MNKVGDTTALMAGVDFESTDPTRLRSFTGPVGTWHRTGRPSAGSGGTHRSRTGACSMSIRTVATTVSGSG